MSENYFTRSELECPCCHKCKIDDSFLNMLNYARKIANIPFIITSGYRCETHNKEVDGVSNSAHTRGFAVDIHAPNSTKRFIIVNALLRAGFKRIGIGKMFVHCDADSSLPQGVMFDYYK